MLDLRLLQERLTTRELGRSVLSREATPSTMDIARREAAEGAPHGTIVLAEEQTAGRGRFGRSWTSPPGLNLYVTLLLRPTSEQMRLLSVMTPLAVAGAFSAQGGRPVLKWPNDVQLDGLKAAGILLESEWLGNEPAFALAGMGMNVNLDVQEHPEIEGIATSLRAHLGRQVEREAVLAGVLDELERLLERPEAVEVLSRYRPLVGTIGERVTVSGAGSPVEGLAEGIDNEGRLLVRDGAGDVHAFSAGEVTLRKP
jgi:BirA family biotin operon repressor/biotin-[acetyl-CoA-carboxylase] ligase